MTFLEFKKNSAKLKLEMEKLKDGRSWVLEQLHTKEKANALYSMTNILENFEVFKYYEKGNEYLCDRICQVLKHSPLIIDPERHEPWEIEKKETIEPSKFILVAKNEEAAEKLARCLHHLEIIEVKDGKITDYPEDYDHIAPRYDHQAFKMADYGHLQAAKYGVIEIMDKGIEILAKKGVEFPKNITNIIKEIDTKKQPIRGL